MIKTDLIEFLKSHPIGYTSEKNFQKHFPFHYNEIIKIWNTGYPYELHGCKIIDNDVDLGIRKAPINPPLIDPELMSKVDPMIINKKKKYHGELTNDIIEEIFKDA